MFEFEEQLIANMTEFREIENETLEPGLTKEQLLGRVQARARKNAGIMADNEAIINTHLKPMLDHPEGISDADADSFFALAQRLYSASANLDIGMAHTIHACLLARAKAKGDIDRIVCELYWLGRSIMMMHSLFSKEAAALFAEGAEYRKQYFEIENKETRMYVNRCIGNVYASMQSMGAASQRMESAVFLESVDQALAFWNDPRVREKDPDFPWDAFIMNSHQNVCAWMDVLRHWKEDKYLAQRIWESMNILTAADSPEGGNRYWPESRTVFTQLTARYHVGQISFNEMLEGIKSIFFNADVRDYSTDGLYRMMYIPSMVLVYLKSSDSVSQEQYETERTAIVDRVIHYCQDIPSGVDKHTMNEYLGPFGLACAISGYSECYLNLMVRFTSFGHLSTYVHALMVGKLTTTLISHLIDRKPELFIGIRGTKDAAGVVAKKKELLELVELVGLCHDIGKISYVNTVALCSRHIYDFEFSIIKQHVMVGFTLPEADETFSCVKDAIVGHHKWYDGTKGYPPVFNNRESKYSVIIDAVCVADCIDAATDSLGRSYARDHSYERVVDEIRKDAGTRYAPEIAAMLSDDGLIEELRGLLTAYRADAYYTAYLDIVSQKGGTTLD